MFVWLHSSSVWVNVCGLSVSVFSRRRFPPQKNPYVCKSPLNSHPTGAIWPAATFVTLILFLPPCHSTATDKRAVRDLATKWPTCRDVGRCARLACKSLTSSILFGSNALMDVNSQSIFESYFIWTGPQRGCRNGLSNARIPVHKRLGHDRRGEGCLTCWIMGISHCKRRRCYHTDQVPLNRDGEQLLKSYLCWAASYVISMKSLLYAKQFIVCILFCLAVWGVVTVD